MGVSDANSLSNSYGRAVGDYKWNLWCFRRWQGPFLNHFSGVGMRWSEGGSSTIEQDTDTAMLLQMTWMFSCLVVSNDPVENIGLVNPVMCVYLRSGSATWLGRSWRAGQESTAAVTTDIVRCGQQINKEVEVRLQANNLPLWRAINFDRLVRRSLRNKMIGAIRRLSSLTVYCRIFLILPECSWSVYLAHECVLHSERTSSECIEPR